jgi:hypothetical protein
MAKEKIQLDDRIKAIDDEHIVSLISNQLKHKDTREEVLSIIEEYADRVCFMDKVKGYASREIDERLFRSFKYWLTLIITPAATTIVTLYLTGFFKK